MLKGFPGGSDGKESACKTEDLGLIPRLPWRRAWQLTPVFLPEESPWTEVPGGLQPLGSQRVGHDQATKYSTTQQWVVTCILKNILLGHNFNSFIVF